MYLKNNHHGNRLYIRIFPSIALNIDCTMYVWGDVIFYFRATTQIKTIISAIIFNKARTLVL